jgi:hypothetical protein
MLLMMILLAIVISGTTGVYNLRWWLAASLRLMLGVLGSSPCFNCLVVTQQILYGGLPRVQLILGALGYLGFLSLQEVHHLFDPFHGMLRVSALGYLLFR